MSNTNIWVTVISIILTFFGGVITLGVHKLLTSKVKNSNLQLLMTWADQAVSEIEKTMQGQTSEAKKQAAVDFIVKKLKENKLASTFSDAQISGVIEIAVRELNLLVGQIINK